MTVRTTRFAPCLASAALLLLSAVSYGDNVPPLGDRFSGMWDVSFKPFADAKTVDRQSAHEIARFQNAAKHWEMSFERAELRNPVALKDSDRANGPVIPGYLTTAVNQLRSSNASTDVLRNEVIDLGDLPVGVLVAKTTDKGQPVLLQEAFIQVSDTLYYSLAMTSPYPAKDAQNDPALADAAQTFKAIIDSIERVDLSNVRQDQDSRLIRTRALFVNWNKKSLLAALKPEQFLLFKRAGEPIGYAYIVEQPADAVPRPGEVQKGVTVAPQDASGFRIGMRTHVETEPGKTVDSENWMFTTFDRRHEVWSSVTVVNNPSAASAKDKQTWFSEVGASDIQRERVFDQGLKADDFKALDEKLRKGENKGVPFTEVDKYRLTVRTEGRSAVAEPLKRELPPFYIPQAIAVLLPRITPLNNPTGYLFASYNSDTRELMYRYLDVKPEADVRINGKLQRAVPVADRFGLQGEPTTHYMSPNGEYLGSVNSSTKLEIDPVDRDTINATFKGANLTQPGGVKD